MHRFGIFCTLAAVTGLEGCVTAPPPLVIAAPPPPAIVYQPPQVYHSSPILPVPSAPTAPVQRRWPAQQLSNGQAIGILTAANNAEIREAQLALRVSRNLRIRRFAQQMINSHSRLNSRLLALSRRLGILPTQSQASQHLTQTAQQALTTLSTMRGRRFNRVYIHHQVVTHRTVLNGINNILLPGTRQPYIRGALLQTRTIITRHLQYAQAVEATLR